MQKFIVQAMAIKVVVLFDRKISGAQELPVEIVHPFVDVVRHIGVLASFSLWCSLASKRVGLLLELIHCSSPDPVNRRLIPELCRFAELGVDLTGAFKANRGR